ncbi:peptide chain release factor 1 [uncultured Stenotrophomonas sp.]|nr:peptide chain release factor 1 [uncultured Stenotrophomonas sp.]
MTPTLRRKLEALAERREELERLLAEPDVVADNTRFRDLSREFAQLEPIAIALADEARAKADLAAAEGMRADPDLRELADEEIAAAQARLQELEQELALLLVPRDPRDEGNLFLEVRAGTGGDEAAIFAGDLFRMYARYAERQGWKVEIESDSPGEHGGYKEVVARVVGRGAFSRLKFESGTHRVQRVPATESQGRIHTSAATVAIIPEADEVDDIVINPADLKVDTFRSSGAGGQHVNKTESAIRITHVPTGVVVECQTERSQHANRDKAMKRLKAQLLDSERSKQAAATAESRRLQVGSGDRSQRIRTYSFPQGRITDHRVEGLTLYDLPNIIAGDMDGLVERLIHEHQADELAQLSAGA